MLAQTWKGIIQIFRPELPFAAGVCVVLVGEIIALGTFPHVREAALGFLCGFFLSGSAIVLNDYFDLEVDQVNTPDRPLPAGILTLANAIVLTVFATSIGLGTSLILGLPSFILPLIFWYLGFYIIGGSKQQVCWEI